MSDRQKITIAIIASLFLHVLGCAFLMIWTRLHPMDFAKAAPNFEPLEVKLVAAATPTPAPLIAANQSATHTRTLLDTDGLTPDEKAPSNAVFESDRNSHAGSETPATGSAPLPGQTGRKLPFTEFKTQDYSMGKGQQPAVAIAKQSNSAPEKPRPSTAEKAQPTPKPKLPIPKELTDASVPRATPFFNPTPVPATTAPPKDTFALGKPTPLPLNSPAPATPTPTPEQVAKLIPPPALRARPEESTPSSEPGTQAFKEKGQIESGITQRGKAGVDAVGTPRGRYEAVMHNMVGSRWNHYVRQKGGLITAGEVTVSFVISQEGVTSNVKVLSNTANDELANITIRAILESKLPPVPEELTPMLRNGRLEIPAARFNCYDLNP